MSASPAIRQEFQAKEKTRLNQNASCGGRPGHSALGVSGVHNLFWDERAGAHSCLLGNCLTVVRRRRQGHESR